MIKCLYKPARRSNDDLKACAALLREAIHAKDLQRARALHSAIKGKQQDEGTFLGNLVVRMYGCCGSIHEAKQAFDAIQERNVFSWNIMLSSLAQNGHLQESKVVFEKMPWHSAVSWNAMSAAVAQCGDEADARDILSRMPEKNLVSWNALLGSYARSGHLYDAKRAFDEMPERDVLSWNTLISGYVHKQEQSLLYAAIAAFERSPQHSVVSWNTVISANAAAGYPCKAQALFMSMPERDVISWNTLISGMMRCGCTAEGRSLFHKMPLQDLVSRIAVGTADAQSGEHGAALELFEQTRDAVLGTSLISVYAASNRLAQARRCFSMIQGHDVVSWTSMITGYVANHQLDNAKLLFDRMPQRDTISRTSMIAGYAQDGHLQQSRSLFLASPHRDSVSYNAMIQAYVVSGSLDQARKFFDEMCNDGQHNSGSWNTMIAAYAQSGHSYESLKMFRRMDLEGIPADSITFISVLDACSSVAALELGKIIHAEVIHRGLLRDAGVATQLIDMYAKCGELHDARRIFDSMPERNLLTWNTMIAAYHGNRRGCTGGLDQILGLFLAMVAEGFEPSEVTLLSVISSFSHAGLFDQSIHYFVSSSVDFGVDMQLDHYQCVIDLLSRLGELGFAKELIEEMPVEPDLTAWKTLLSACRVHGDCHLAARVAMKILELDPDDVSMYRLLAGTLTSDLSLSCCHL